MARFARRLSLFATGAAAGAVTAALLTPKTGRAMRKSVQKEFRHSRNSATRFARGVAGNVRSAYDSGRHAAGRLKTLGGRFRAA